MLLCSSSLRNKPAPLILVDSSPGRWRLLETNSLNNSKFHNCLLSGRVSERIRGGEMEACSRIGESTDAIVMDESPTDERDIQQACQRWVFIFFACCYLWCRVCNLTTVGKITEIYSSRRGCVLTLRWPMWVLFSPAVHNGIMHWIWLLLLLFFSPLHY